MLFPLVLCGAFRRSAILGSLATSCPLCWEYSSFNKIILSYKKKSNSRSLKGLNLHCSNCYLFLDCFLIGQRSLEKIIFFSFLEVLIFVTLGFKLLCSSCILPVK